MNLILNIHDLIFLNWQILQINDINRLPNFFSRKYVCLLFLLLPKPITFSPVQLFSVVHKNTSQYYNIVCSCLKSIFSKFSQILIPLRYYFIVKSSCLIFAFCGCGIKYNVFKENKSRKNIALLKWQQISTHSSQDSMNFTWSESLHNNVAFLPSLEAPGVCYNGLCCLLYQCNCHIVASQIYSCGTLVSEGCLHFLFFFPTTQNSTLSQEQNRHFLLLIIDDI